MHTTCPIHNETLHELTLTLIMQPQFVIQASQKNKENDRITNPQKATHVK